MDHSVKRRSVIGAVGGLAIASLAGCLGDGTDGAADDTDDAVPTTATATAMEANPNPRPSAATDSSTRLRRIASRFLTRRR